VHKFVVDNIKGLSNTLRILMGDIQLEMKIEDGVVKKDVSD